ncbi:hypothetical protein GT755_38335 [Herbidospora sp. NEAU-GS84]|uniref:Uncharacterized protein n=1 Tax=Herbidospora solisilvae TaxID=2696284 RepID=A0A7C9N7R8_9ACTN|nr:hypothetical protein [Herbidospora solisilvae]NAS27514.1 hypothetical protein [Herbidospora solisilvae]
MADVYLTTHVDRMDVEIERLSRLISKGAELDRELAAGLGVSISIPSVQTDIDRASAAVEALSTDFKKWSEERDKPRTTRTRS